MNMGLSRKKKDRLQYPCISSTIQLVPHSADMPIPDAPKKYEIVKDYVEKGEFIGSGTSHDPDFEAGYLNELHRLNKAELSDLVRYLDLPKQKAKLLASKLLQWNSTPTKGQDYRVQNS
ncbi:hypothetical protein TNIN_357741 [Trichonephila inaurata madagascariensis]|uniref:Uncharacterized protein n=1 Tax=Trichonephila inaurata madagascariensis TaxID=2747483 RepID=A0A8X6KMQ9_9ARAC|nr:hypothetical protein TNIN_357741 [Trichonephila inaurata madagascariensis]